MKEREDSNVWMPGEDKIERVLTACRAIEAPTFLMKDLRGLDDLSNSVVRRAVNVLREREHIRLASRTGGEGGNAHVYALLDG